MTVEGIEYRPVAPGDEAPAIVDLIVQVCGPPGLIGTATRFGLGRRLTHRACVSTLLDLAARGRLHITADEAGALTGHGSGSATGTSLAAFERHLLEFAVGRLAGGRTPAAALLPDAGGDDGMRWHGAFRRAVIDEARELGLVRDRFSAAVRWSLRLAAGIPTAAAVWLLLLSGGGGTLPWSIFLGSLAAWVLLLASPVLRRLHVTAAGRASARGWLAVRGPLMAASAPVLPAPGGAVEDRMLAWAVALGAADNVLAAIPRPPRSRIWSRGSRGWRLVHVGGVRPSARRPNRRPPDVVALDRIVRGPVIRRWTVYSGTNDAPSTSYYLAVDDGDGDEALAWGVSQHVHGHFPTGSLVRCTVDPKGRLVDMTRVAALDWPAELPDQVVDRVLAAVAPPASPAASPSPGPQPRRAGDEVIAAPVPPDVGRLRLRTGGHGLAALAVGIIAVPVSLVPIAGIPLPVLGLILGLNSLATPTRGYAIAGIVVSAIAVVVNWLATILLVLVLVLSATPG